MAPIFAYAGAMDWSHAEVVELFIRHAGHKGIVRLKTAKGNTAFDETIQHGTKNLVTRKILTVRRKCHAMPLPCPRAPSIDEASQPSPLSSSLCLGACMCAPFCGWYSILEVTACARVCVRV